MGVEREPLLYTSHLTPLNSLFSVFMESVHGLLRTFEDEDFEGFHVSLDHLFKFFLFPSGKRLQNKIRGILPGDFRPADSHFETNESAVAQGFDDRADSLMTAVPPPDPEAYLAPRQVQVIVKNDHHLRLKLEKLEKPLSGFSR